MLADEKEQKEVCSHIVETHQLLTPLPAPLVRGCCPLQSLRGEQMRRDADGRLHVWWAEGNGGREGER